MLPAENSILTFLLTPAWFFWKHQIQAGLTYNPDKKKLWNASGCTTSEFNHSKFGIDVKPGPAFTGEYGFGRHFFNYPMNAGIGAPTPRIDKLAAEGTRLLNFNVEARCMPSRSALMTGRFSIRSAAYAVPMGGLTECRSNRTFGQFISYTYS